MADSPFKKKGAAKVKEAPVAVGDSNKIAFPQGKGKMCTNYEQDKSNGLDALCVYPRSWIAVWPRGDGLNVVRIVYSDESEQGTGAAKLVVVAAIMLNMDGQWHKLQKHFRMLPKGWLKRREVKGNRLLRDLHKDRGPESDRALRILCAIPSNIGIPVFSGAVDPSGLTLNPYDVAFRLCMNDVDAYLDIASPRETILCIADVAGYSPRMKMVQAMQRLEPLSNISAYFEGKRTKRFKSHLVDTVYFGDSHESRALQLADVYCSVIGGHLLGDPVAEPYYEILRPRIVNEPRVISKPVRKR